jgi:hypothetical protein
MSEIQNEWVNSASNLTHQDRLNIQKVIQKYPTKTPKYIKEIRITKSMTKSQKNNYLKEYIKKTYFAVKPKWLSRKQADGYVYVRAPADSDYDYFKENTKLPEQQLHACDDLQAL